MEVTKEFLEGQIGGLTQQLDGLMNQAAQVHGALAECKSILKHFETPEVTEEELAEDE